MHEKTEETDNRLMRQSLDAPPNVGEKNPEFNFYVC